MGKIYGNLQQFLYYLLWHSREWWQDSLEIWSNNGCINQHKCTLRNNRHFNKKKEEMIVLNFVYIVCIMIFFFPFALLIFKNRKGCLQAECIHTCLFTTCDTSHKYIYTHREIIYSERICFSFFQCIFIW